MPHANQSQHNCWACDNPQGLVVLEAMEVFPAIRTLTNQPKIDPQETFLMTKTAMCRLPIHCIQIFAIFVAALD